MSFSHLHTLGAISFLCKAKYNKMSSNQVTATAASVAKIIADNKARFEAMRLEQASQKKHLAEQARRSASKSRDVSQAKSKPGAPSIVGIYLTNWVSKKSATGVAASGQAGGGSGAPKNVAVNLIIMPSVTKLAERLAPGQHYRIVDSRTIEIPATCSDDRKKAFKLLDDAKKLKADTPEREAAIKFAEEEITKAERIIEWLPITDGEVCNIKTFDEAATKRIGMMQPVQCMGVEANYSVWEGNPRTELLCSAPVPLNTGAPPFVALSELVDLQQIAVQLPDMSKTWGPTMIFYFANYTRDPEDAANGRGCVEFKSLANSLERKDYKIVSKKEGVATRLKHTYSMGQLQDGSNPKYTVPGMFIIQALFIEGAPEEAKGNTTLRAAFGINDPDTYAAIMAANAPPAIIAGSVNMKDLVKVNPGADHRRDIGTIPIWGNAAHFLLRPYLLTQCAQVSMDWVCKRLKIKPAGGTNLPNVWAKSTDPIVRLDRYNPKNPCKLNENNLLIDQNAGTTTLVGELVINVSEFTGDLHDVMRRSSTPCEFRVMHSSQVSEEDRARLALFTPAQAEKVLSCADDAEIALEQEGVDKNGGVICVIYLVATMSAEERQQYAEADNKWRIRHEASLAAAAAAAEEAYERSKLDQVPKVDVEGDVVMGDAPADADVNEEQQQEEGVEHTVIDAGDAESYQATVLVPSSQQQDAQVDEEAEDALRRQLEEEAEQERAAAVAKKRRHAATAEEDGASSEAAPRTGRKKAPPASRKASKYE